MSDDEEMIIRGRLMTEYANAKRTRTILQTERDRLGKLIASLGVSVQGEFPYQVSTPKDEQFDALDADKIRELLKETEENASTLEDLAKKLTGLGLL